MFKIGIEVHNCTAIINWNKVDNEDWVWQSTMTHCTVSPGGRYSIYQLVRFVQGVASNVPNSEFDKIFDKHMDKYFYMPCDIGDYDTLVGQKFTGYTLMTPDIARALATQVDDIYNSRYGDDDEISAEEEHQYRL